MLQFKADSGHVFYLNHLISFICVMLFGMYLSFKVNKKEWDKVLHCGISFGTTILLLFLFNILGWAWWISPVLVLGAGFTKEVIDRINKKKQLFDWHDIVADLLGVAAPAVTYWLSVILYVEM